MPHNEASRKNQFDANELYTDKQKKNEVEANELSAEIVAEYLRDHPDFFLHRPELLERLSLFQQQQGTVSLTHIQMSRQRQRIEELEEEITGFMSLAASNDRTFRQFMDWQEEVLKCNSIMQVISVIEQKALSFNLQAYVRLTNAEQEEYRLSPEQWKRFSTNHFNGKDAYLGRMRLADRTALLGDITSAPDMGSYIVLPLVQKHSQGILAFSSEDGSHFQPSMDTLFLRHLAQVISYILDSSPWQNDG